MVSQKHAKSKEIIPEIYGYAVYSRIYEIRKKESGK